MAETKSPAKKRPALTRRNRLRIVGGLIVFDCLIGSVRCNEIGNKGLMNGLLLSLWRIVRFVEILRKKLSVSW
jgi:hypothetical protein